MKNKIKRMNREQARAGGPPKEADPKKLKRAQSTGILSQLSSKAGSSSASTAGTRPGSPFSSKSKGLSETEMKLRYGSKLNDSK
jgi:hypothetical protein